MRIQDPPRNVRDAGCVLFPSVFFSDVGATLSVHGEGHVGDGKRRGGAPFHGSRV